LLLSGGVTTRTGFRETGNDRTARHYDARLVPFEEQPLYRYFVSNAEIQKELYLHRNISSVMRGEMLSLRRTDIETGTTCR
jgi:hypothetical protein